MNTTTIANLSNDELDTAIATAAPTDPMCETEWLLALFDERTARIERARAEILAAEAAWEAEIDAQIAAEADEADEIIRVRRLSGLQVETFGTEIDLAEDIADDVHWVEGRTFVETTRAAVEALYSRIDGSDPMNDMGYCETDAQAEMARRAGLVSRESMCAKLARVLGWDDEADAHEFNRRRIAKASSWNLMDEN